MNKIFLFLLGVMLITQVLGSQIIITPTKLEFIGETGQEICNKINILTDYPGDIVGKTVWGESDSKRLQDYQMSAEDVGIDMNFPESINIDGSEDEEICLTSRYSGEYHGALLYNTNQSHAGVGIWITAAITGEDKPSLSRITGDTIRINSNKNKNNGEIWLIFYFIPTIFLLFILMVLLIFMTKKKVINRANI